MCQWLVIALFKHLPDHNDDTMTVFDRWLENRPSSTGFPSIGLPGLGSDYAPFTHLTGLNIVDVGFSQSSRVLRSSYSTYHTGYDNFEYIDIFIDPGFRQGLTWNSISEVRKKINKS